MKIVEYKLENEKKEFLNDLKYWSNGCGELHHHGEYDIKEEELPNELKRAYEELWTDGTGSYCYLVEYKGKFGIALSNEFNETYAEDICLTMDDLYVYMKKKAEEFCAMDAFKDATILLGDYTVPDGHEFITILPWDVKKHVFQTVSEVLFKNVYDQPKKKNKEYLICENKKRIAMELRVPDFGMTGDVVLDAFIGLENIKSDILDNDGIFIRMTMKPKEKNNDPHKYYMTTCIKKVQGLIPLETARLLEKDTGYIDLLCAEIVGLWTPESVTVSKLESKMVKQCFMDSKLNITKKQTKKSDMPIKVGIETCQKFKDEYHGIPISTANKKGRVLLEKKRKKSPEAFKYMNEKGRYSEFYESLDMPNFGMSDNEKLNVVIAINNIYYDIYNNGGCNLKDMEESVEAVKNVIPFNLKKCRDDRGYLETKLDEMAKKLFEEDLSYTHYNVYTDEKCDICTLSPKEDFSRIIVFGSQEALDTWKRQSYWRKWVD